jgi:hypothetical protein
VHPVFHTSQLKEVSRYHVPEAPIVLEDSYEPEYEVEKIVDTRVVRGTRQFLVKWKNFGTFESSWEPESNLGNAKRIVTEFLS